MLVTEQGSVFIMKAKEYFDFGLFVTKAYNPSLKMKSMLIHFEVMELL